MAYISNFQDVNNQLQEMSSYEVITPQPKEEKMVNTVIDGLSKIIPDTVSGISNGVSSTVSHTINSVPTLMDEQRKNFVFQFGEVMECINMMKEQGIIRTDDSIIIEPVKEHNGFNIAIGIGIVILALALI